MLLSPPNIQDSVSIKLGGKVSYVRRKTLFLLDALI